MKKRPKHLIKKFLLLVSVIYVNSIYSDSYEYNLYNNYGIVGTIHTPSARTFDEGVHGVTLYNGTPNQTVTLSASPFDWLEASFFYTNIQDRPSVMILLVNSAYKILKIKVLMLRQDLKNRVFFLQLQ